MAPLSPTAQTSPAPVPQTPLNGYSIALATGVQTLPSQWRITPLSPISRSLTPSRRHADVVAVAVGIRASARIILNDVHVDDPAVPIVRLGLHPRHAVL